VKGHRIKTLDSLMAAAADRRAIIAHPTLGRCWTGPRPAAFAISWPARSVFYLLRSGIYLYVSPRVGRKQSNETKNKTKLEKKV
jgi:hypothetical protein